MSGTEPFGFGIALRMLKAGRKVARVGWNTKGLWIAIHYPEGGKMTRPYIYLRTADNDLVPWAPSQSDVLMADWHEEDE